MRAREAAAPIAHRPGARLSAGGALPLVVMLTISAAAAMDIDVESDSTGHRFWLLPPGDHLALQDTAPPPVADPVVSSPGSERRPNWLLTSLIASAAVVGATLNSVLDFPNVPYHFGNEGWYGQNSHFGGADKNAHFVDYYIVSKEFAKLFVLLGHKPENARWLAAGVSAFTGLVNEIGDGSNRYGFSYEDLVMDVGGALSAALIDAAGAEDLIGYRRGLVNFDN